jgi:hypothetical protein
MVSHDEREVDMAWRAWELLTALSDLLWEHYEPRFLSRCMCESYEASRCVSSEHQDDSTSPR